MRNQDPTAFRGLFACNVNIPVRYFETYLDSVEAGDTTCQDFMTHFLTSLSAMTMYSSSLDEMAAKIETDGGEEALAEALGPAADEAMTGDRLEDPKRLVKDRLAPRVVELCPDIAAYVVR